MKTFKSGDWIKEPNGTLVKLKETPEPGSYYTDDCTLCQPKQGDYLWDKQFRLSLVMTNSHKGKLQCKAIFGYKETFFAKYNKDCQPFIGQLPNFLKEDK